MECWNSYKYLVKNLYPIANQKTILGKKIWNFIMNYLILLKIQIKAQS